MRRTMIKGKKREIRAGEMIDFAILRSEGNMLNNGALENEVYIENFKGID